MEKETIIISLGGSVFLPAEFDIDFLKKFRDLILKYSERNRFLIYVGGGKICRIYQKALAEFGGNSRRIDWLGIHITRLNAQIIKNLFKKISHPEIIINPEKKICLKKDILIAAGWKPGWSTDYDAVLLAKNLGAKTILNISNVDYVYDKNPKKFSKTKSFKKLNWPEFRQIVGEKWLPGLSLPFDPIAAKLAQELKMTVAIINGQKLDRVDNFLNKKSFVGTVIS